MVLRERQSEPSPDDPGAADPRRRAARRGVVGVLAGALIMLVAASAFAMSGQNLDVLGLSGTQKGSSSGPVAGSSTDSDDDAPPPLTSAPGSCLTWARDDASDVRQVDCSASHLFENVGPVNAAQPPGAPFPADAAWQQVVTDQCTRPAATGQVR